MNDQTKQEVVKPAPTYGQVSDRILMSGVAAFAVMVGVATIIRVIKEKE